MPFIHTITNKTVNTQAEEELRRQLGRAIELFPGKSEQWLMLALSDGRRMAFRGRSDAACAMVEVSLFGKATAQAKEDFTAAVCAILHEVLAVDGERVYVKYAECDDWGFNGANF